METLRDSFAFGNSNVRVTQDETGVLWFVAKDVAEALEYQESSITQIINLVQPIPEEWKGLKPIKTLGGRQDVHCLAEPGLYWFLGRSDKPKALPFQKWIYGEVLPSIRKTGSYELHMNMDEVKQLVRLPEPYKRDAFRRLLAQAGKHGDKSEGTRLMLNVCCIFAAAESGAPIKQAHMTF